MDNKTYLKKYKRCILEYTSLADTLAEEGDEETMVQDPNAMGGGAPEMGGGAPEMGQDPNGMGNPNMDDGTMSDPNMVDNNPNDPNMAGDNMAAMGNNGVEGFNPEGGANNGPMNMGMEETPTETLQPEDEVIDVDDLTQSQENAEKKLDKMSAKFEKLMGAMEILIKQNAERDSKEAEAEARLKSELEKRIPTPQQRMSMRSTKSSPYSMTPNEYMNNYAPENYSDEDDNNGADDAQYQITKNDIDKFTDFNSIAKELDVEHQGLHDILGF